MTPIRWPLSCQISFPVFQIPQPYLSLVASRKALCPSSRHSHATRTPSPFQSMICSSRRRVVPVRREGKRLDPPNLTWRDGSRGRFDSWRGHGPSKGVSKHTALSTQFMAPADGRAAVYKTAEAGSTLAGASHRLLRRSPPMSHPRRPPRTVRARLGIVSPELRQRPLDCWIKPVPPAGEKPGPQPSVARSPPRPRHRISGMMSPVSSGRTAPGSMIGRRGGTSEAVSGASGKSPDNAGDLSQPIDLERTAVASHVS